MKIVTYILLSLVVVLAFLGYYYASSQETTMRVLVGARAGFSEEPAGMELINKNLVTEAATVAKTRSDTLKANASRQAEAVNAAEKMEDAHRVAETHKADMERVQAKIEEASQHQEELAKKKDELLAQLHGIPGMEDTDMETAVDTLHSIVTEDSESIAKLKEQSQKLTGQRKELNKEVSDATVDYNTKKEQNNRFLEPYRNNGTQYTIAAVNPQWHFVVFNAGEDSGFYPGDKTQLLVQRNGVAIATLHIVSVSAGQVVAEYDEEKLPRGVMLEVGDLVLRKVPLGS